MAKVSKSNEFLVFLNHNHFCCAFPPANSVEAQLLHGQKQCTLQNRAALSILDLLLHSFEHRQNFVTQLNLEEY